VWRTKQGARLSQGQKSSEEEKEFRKSKDEKELKKELRTRSERTWDEQRVFEIEDYRDGSVVCPVRAIGVSNTLVQLAQGVELNAEGSMGPLDPW